MQYKTPMYPNYFRSFACVDFKALETNFNNIKSYLNKDVKVMAVVKADAYGHGAVNVAKHFNDKVDYFAVAVIEEAIELRQAGVTKPILILSYTNITQYHQLIENDITATIYDEQEAINISKVAQEMQKEVVMHVAIETGMNRVGFADNEQSVEIIERIQKLPYVKVEGIFSHYACADEADKTSANKQTARFDAFLEKLNKRNIDIPIKHMCNSGGIIDLENHYDMIRIGILMYGLYPSEQVQKQNISLVPAMKVVSHVIYIKEVKKGERIGYGHTYEVKEDKKIATVCIGYADGYSRSLSNKGYVLIGGKKAPITGNVCMDQVMVDVTDFDDIKVGDHVVVLGKDGDLEITAEEFGELSLSFNYEVICTFMPRIKRFYYYGEQLLPEA